MNIKQYKLSFWALYRNFFGKTSYSRVQLNKWLSQIKICSDRILEVGASLNPVVKKVKKWNVKEYKTLDNNLEAQCNPDFEIDLNALHWSDMRGWTSRNKSEESSIQKVLKYKPNVLFCLEVMEYIYKPETVLKFFYDILAPKGKLYISFHTIYPVHEPYKHDSLRYTKWGIIQLLEDVGFKSLNVVPRTATKGQPDLKKFFQKEKMFVSRKSQSAYDIGYFIEANK